MPKSNRSLLLVIVGIALSLIAVWLWPRNPAQHNALTSRTLAMKALAGQLARDFPGKRALVVANPFARRKSERPEIYDYQQAALKGLRDGFGNKVEIGAVDYPELQKEARSNPTGVYVDPRTTTPLSYLVSPDSFDVLARNHSNCDLLISVIGLPVNITHTDVWKRSDLKIALLLPDWRTIGDQETVRRAFKSGKIAAAILNKPGAPSESLPIEGESPTSFDERYLLVTPQTIDDFIARYPQAF